MRARANSTQRAWEQQKKMHPLVCKESWIFQKWILSPSVLNYMLRYFPLLLWWQCNSSSLHAERRIWGILLGEALCKDWGWILSPGFRTQRGPRGRIVGKYRWNNKVFALKGREVCSTIKEGQGFKGKHMSKTYGSSLFERKICLLLILYNISHGD